MLTEPSVRNYIDKIFPVIDQYISRVDETPCMKTSIHLFKGPETPLNHDRRGKLLSFLRGTKKDKEELKKKEPTLYKYFREVWRVRVNHMDNSFPSNYVFMLKCCGMRNCPHPLCQGHFNIHIEINIYFLYIISGILLYLPTRIWSFVHVLRDLLRYFARLCLKS